MFAEVRYDNLTSAVKQVLKGRRRAQSDRFVALRSHYLFESLFTTPGIAGAHEKGGVEGEVGRLRRNHLVPVPCVDSIAQLNARLLAACEHDLDRRIAGRPGTVAEQHAFERPVLRALPVEAFDATELASVRVDAKALVTVRQNRLGVVRARPVLEVILEHEDASFVASSTAPTMCGSRLEAASPSVHLRALGDESLAARLATALARAEDVRNHRCRERQRLCTCIAECREPRIPATGPERASAVEQRCIARGDQVVERLVPNAQRAPGRRADERPHPAGAHLDEHRRSTSPRPPPPCLADARDERDARRHRPEPSDRVRLVAADHDRVWRQSGGQGPAHRVVRAEPRRCHDLLAYADVERLEAVDLKLLTVRRAHDVEHGQYGRPNLGAGEHNVVALARIGLPGSVANDPHRQRKAREEPYQALKGRRDSLAGAIRADDARELDERPDRAVAVQRGHRALQPSLTVVDRERVAAATRQRAPGTV